MAYETNFASHNWPVYLLRRNDYLKFAIRITESNK